MLRNTWISSLKAALLAKSAEFYRLKNKEWSQNSSCAEYLSNIEKLLQEEEKRLEDILYGTPSHETIKNIITLFDEETVKVYKTLLVTKDTGLTYMLQNEQYNVNKLRFLSEANG